MTNLSKNGGRETAFECAKLRVRELAAQRATQPQMFLVETVEGRFLGEVSPLSDGRWMARPYGRSYPDGVPFDTAEEADNYIREGA